jgi:hypothetical protein
VHELDLRLPLAFISVHVDLVLEQQIDALLPHFLRLAHRDPHVGVDEVDAVDRFLGIVGDGELRAGLRLQLLAIAM